MGWHYILKFSSKILPEYVSFIEKRYLENLYDPSRDVDYYTTPKRFYDSDDEKAEEEKKQIEEFYKERKKEDENRKKEYDALSKDYKDLIDIWTDLDIGCHFYKYDFNGSLFTCKISKKVIVTNYSN